MPSTSSSVSGGQHSSAATSLNRKTTTTAPKITLRQASSSSPSADKKKTKGSSSTSAASSPDMELLNVANLRNLAGEAAASAAEIPSAQEVLAEVKDDSPRLYLLYGIFILQLTIGVTEVIVDNLTHSVLILTDGYHHLFNACNAFLLVLSFKISTESTVKNTFGYVRLEVLGMLATTTFIVALIFSLFIEALLQLSHLHEIHHPTDPRVLLIFGGWSLVVNLFYVLTINGVMTEKKYKETTREERAFSTANCQMPIGRHLKRASTSLAPSDSTVQVVSSTTTTSGASTSDNNDSNNNGKNQVPPATTATTTDPTNCFFGSLLKGTLIPVFILVTSAVMFFLLIDDRHVELRKSIDPGMSVATAIILCVSFYPQLKEHFLILMQTVPVNINVQSLKEEMLQMFPIMQNVHEFHIWRLTSTKIVATCHIVLPRMSTAEYASLFNAIRGHLSSPQYRIAYVTIQPEFSNWTAAKGGDGRDGGEQQVSSSTTMVTENQCFMKCPRTKVQGGCDGKEEVPECEALTCCAPGNDDLSQVAIHGHGHSHHGDHGH